MAEDTTRQEHEAGPGEHSGHQPAGRAAVAAGAIGLLALAAAAGVLWWAPGQRLLLGLLAGLAAVASGVAAAIEWRPVLRALGRRRVRYGATEAVRVGAVLAALVLANVAAARVAPVIDLTEGRLHTLSGQTERVLAALDTDVDVLVFAETGAFYEPDFRNLLAEYRRRSTRLRYEFVDPALRPSVARAHGVSEPGTVAVVAGGRSRHIPVLTLFAQGDHPDGLKFAGEQALTQAIVALTREQVHSVLFTAGHGEPDPFEALTGLVQALARELYRVDTLNLARQAIPEDAGVLIVFGPQRDLSPPEVERLDAWLRSGGRLVVLLDPAPPGSFATLTRWLADWGVKVHDDVVVDPKRALFTDPMSPVARLDWHPLTEDLILGNLAVALPRARSMVAGVPPAGHEVQWVLGTSDAAWGERDFTAPEPRHDPEDTQHPFSMGLAVATVADAGEEAAGEPRLLVVGSSGFLHPPLADFQGNGDFFLNAVNWLVGEEEQPSIRPKQRIFRRVFLTPGDARFIFNTTVFGVPLLTLALASAVWLRRRGR